MSEQPAGHLPAPRTELGSAGVARARRWRALGQRGATVWCTGLPASGKSTLAAHLERALTSAGRSAYVIDGDGLRRGLCRDLGFTRADRDENVRRAGETALLLRTRAS